MCRNRDTFRKAEAGDLPGADAFYRAAAERMRLDGLDLWDEVYPCCCLERDIADGRLFLLLRGGEILAAVSLCREHPAQNAVRQRIPAEHPFYLERFAVNAAMRRQGLGRKCIAFAAEAAGNLGADALRLFAAKENIPALRFYEKAGFSPAEGEYTEIADETLPIPEIGLEKKI